MGLTGALLAGVATAAVARSGNGYIWVGTSTQNLEGNVTWWAKGSNHGGMQVSGTLSDTAADSNSVKALAKVSGYSYSTIGSTSGGSGATVWVDRVVYDPQATWVTYGWVQTCRYNSWGTDSCATEYMTR
ncbi:hypothetical protein ACIA8O_11630 [Kitasatospora sp. NPDC051853]|uniref:hypothetical protein n=1 Tax=Kitasatospora sp. NPDC051853 TaxID=3364058 RepID=UPI0037A689DF